MVKCDVWELLEKYVNYFSFGYIFLMDVWNYEGGLEELLCFYC